MYLILSYNDSTSIYLESRAKNGIVFVKREKERVSPKVLPIGTVYYCMLRHLCCPCRVSMALRKANQKNAPHEEVCL